MTTTDVPGSVPGSVSGAAEQDVAVRPDPVSPPSPGASTARGWSLRRRLGRGLLALAVLVAGCSVGVVVASFVRLHTSNVLVSRLQPAEVASDQLLDDLVNQETGLRGYLLTRQEAALGPYVTYIPEQRRDRRTVLRLVGSYPGVRADVSAFDAAARRWRRSFAAPILREAHGGRPSGVSDPDAGRSLFDRIRVRSTAVRNRIDGLVEHQQRARATQNLIFNVLLAALLAVMVASGVVLWLGLHRFVLVPVRRLAGQTRVVAVGALDHEIDTAGPAELQALGADVEAMRARLVRELDRADRIADDLRRQSDELGRSNADLQQFAYVASHDLSEPLRKVANFCQLLERQYGPQLDDRARTYIDFAVDGARRMQALINDLLALSRVGRNTEGFEPIDLEHKLDQALANISERIAAAGATIERPAPLPTVPGDRTLLTSLLENLVGNAVKYHRENTAPIVRIEARHEPQHGRWRFTVSDNGIGIDPQYADKIFAVFQRLHLRDQYGGTGIGLALCRRIVEFHGGRIWLENVDSGPGATFAFTLPEGPPVAEHLR